MKNTHTVDTHDIYALLDYFVEWYTNKVIAETGKPPKSTGVRGVALEKAGKVFFGVATLETAKLSDKTKKDFRKTVDGSPSYFESKSGSGNYGHIETDGTETNYLDGNKYVMYQATETSPIYIVPKDDFDREVKLHFTRKPKYQTEMQRLNNTRKDTICMKTINDGTSHRERDRINAMCSTYGQEIYDFVACHNIKMPK